MSQFEGDVVIIEYDLAEHLGKVSSIAPLPKGFWSTPMLEADRELNEPVLLEPVLLCYFSIESVEVKCLCGVP